METLVLNSAYMPIDRISWMTAIGNLLKGKAEVVDTYENMTVSSGNGDLDLPWTFDALRTKEEGIWKVPSIIRFLTGAVFHRRRVKFNRHNVYLRDKGRCLYCGTKLSSNEFTFDHVLPRSRGGKTCWKNIAGACVPCNHKKANRTPEEAGMRLRREPFIPMHLPGHVSPALQWKDGMPDSWKSFLESVRYWHSKLD